MSQTKKKTCQLLPVLSQSVIYYKENIWEIEGIAKGKKKDKISSTLYDYTWNQKISKISNTGFLFDPFLG